MKPNDPKPFTKSDHSAPPALHSELLRWLSQPAAYPDPTAEVRRIETHISCVFLTDRFAYKLKKPVRFEFLDFSTLALRRRACEDELRLNRRLAEEVYLGLVAVRKDATGGFRLDESPPPDAAVDEVVEWLVKMRRLPEDATLLAHIEAGTASDEHADAIADRLAWFYRSAAPLAVEPAAYRADLQRHIRGNLADLLRHEHDLADAAIGRIHGAQLRLLALKSELFDARASAGRLVDGHGDLRPEHIYLNGSERSFPAIIDCIEFSDEFRRLDVADELCFLASECDFAGAPALGQRIVDRTLAALNDHPPSELLAFYRSYRACVRAKVAALRSAQLAGPPRKAALADARRHLAWADRYDRQLPRPLLLVMSGLMGSGKSTLAAALAEALGAEILSTDAVRRERFGPSQRPSAFGQGVYSEENRRHVYDTLFTRAAQRLDQGISVILDGAFLSAALRSQALQLARDRGLVAKVVRCVCPEPIARRRIAGRLAAGDSHSEARPELYDQQRRHAEFDPADPHQIEIDTTNTTNDQMGRLLPALRSAIG